jgi:hypothetical protein
LSHSTNPNQDFKIEIRNFLNHSGLKLEVNNRKTSGNSLNPWKLKTYTLPSVCDYQLGY